MIDRYLVAALEIAIAFTRHSRYALGEWEDRLLEARDVRANLPGPVADLRHVIKNGDPCR